MALLLVPSLAAVEVAALRPAVLVLDVLLGVAVLVDLLRTPSPRLLDVRRGAPDAVGLSVDLVRRARIEPGPAAGLWCELREEFSPELEVVARSDHRPGAGPVHDGVPGLVAVRAGAPEPGIGAQQALDPTGGPDVVRLPLEGPLDVLRVYRGTRRGRQWLGDLRLRLRGPLGLVQRQARLAGRLELSVEPALLGLRATLRLAASERWHDLGVRRLRRRGGRTEFESLRDYVLGDDVRTIDWKAFARRGRPTVREYRDERGQELLLVVDAGRRMGTTTPGPAGTRWSKLDHALDAALQLAAVALGRGDRVGIAAFDAQLLACVAPARGALQLERLREAVHALQPRPVESDPGRALRELGVRHPRRALLVLLTDVADPLSVEDQRRALGGAARHHVLVVACLDDPDLRAVAAAPGRDVALRAAALGLVREREEALAVLRRSGARVLDTLPADAAAPLLTAWLEERRSL